MPIMFANVLQIVYTIVDTVVVGKFVGTVGISAVSSASTVILLFTNFSMGISSAGEVIIAQFLGKNDKNSVSKSIGTMFTFVASVAVILTMISLPCTRFLLDLVNTPDEALDSAVEYAMCSFSGLVFIFGYSSVGAMLRGLGDSRHPFVFIAVATVMNAVLDIIFVGVLKMGAVGAALATVISQGFSFLFSIGYLFVHREAFGFDFKLKSFVPEPEILKLFIKLAFPMALQHVVVNISSMYVASCVNSYGVLVSALTGIGDKLRMVVAIFSSSFGTASTAMIGQNFGAGKHDRVKRIYITALFALIVTCAFLGMLGMVFPNTVVSMFDSNPELLAMAPRYMVINFLTYVAFAIYVPVNSLIHGIGFASFALINGLIDGFIARIGLVWLLGTVLDNGFWGVWWGAALASYVGAAIGTVYFLSGLWRKHKTIAE